MKYKIIAIDLDGTLLNDNKKISIYNRKFLKKLIKKGYEIVIATGRRYWSAKEFVKDIDGNLTILANNGSIARNINDDKVLMKNYLNIHDFHILIKEGRKLELYPIIHVDNYKEGYDMIIELEKNSPQYWNYISNNENRFKKVKDLLKDNSLKVLAVVYIGSRYKLDKFNEFIKRQYPKRYNSHVIHNVRIAEAFMEVMHPLGSKWLSLEQYAVKRKISKSEIIAIGDDINDLEMIKNAGVGIAMINGSHMIKQVADVVTNRSNNESGVACVLSKLLNI